VLHAAAPDRAAICVPTVPHDSLLLRPLLERCVARDEVVIRADMEERYIPTSRKDVGAEASVARHAFCNRHRQLDLKLALHVDNEEADERRACGRNPVLPRRGDG
jgi:hypothetical protein